MMQIMEARLLYVLHHTVMCVAVGLLNLTRLSTHGHYK
jgi:hypothetical protein